MKEKTIGVFLERILPLEYTKGINFTLTEHKNGFYSINGAGKFSTVEAIQKITDLVYPKAISSDRVKLGDDVELRINGGPAKFIDSWDLMGTLFPSTHGGKIWKAKPPKSKANHVGIEIECFGPVPVGILAKIIAKSPVAKYIQPKEDGSIFFSTKKHRIFAASDAFDDEFSYEFCVTAPENKISKVLKDFCKILKENKCQTNSSCGLHVHLDMRNRDAKAQYKKLVNSQELLSRMHPGRSKNDYCNKNKSTDIEKSREFGRYQIVNPCSIERLNTIEVRVASGTVNYVAIDSWVKLLVAIVNTPSFNLTGSNVGSQKKALKTLKLSPKSRAILSKRIERPRHYYGLG